MEDHDRTVTGLGLKDGVNGKKNMIVKVWRPIISRMFLYIVCNLADYIFDSILCMYLSYFLPIKAATPCGGFQFVNHPLTERR